MSQLPLRQGQNGGNGYINGYYSHDTSNHYDQDYNDGGPVGGEGAGAAWREQRDVEFHDGATSAESDSQEPHTLPHSRGQDSESVNGTWAEKPDIGGQAWAEQSRSRGDGTARVGDGQGSRQIEDVLQHIQQDWNFMTRDDCVPVQVALQLMDTSTLGRADRYSDFQQTHQQLQKALKAIVNEHHQGFNSSIGTFHKIQSSIQSSQNRVKSLKDSLTQAKASLSTTKPELQGLATSSQKFDDILQVLRQVEQLQLVPEKLDARISEKRFLTAVDVLQDALRLIRRSELEDIGALTDLRVYFSSQETSVTDILIEELHDHLYLKSPYCQDRWKPYAQDQNEAVETDSPTASLANSWGRALYNFLHKLNTTSPMTEDTSRNPEADSFYYIQMIIESLNKMGRLDIAVDRMEQRLPVELFTVVDRTNNEVDHRHPSHVRGQAKTKKRFIDFGLTPTDGRSNVLLDLLWTMYSKFEAIAEGHRVVHDVVAGIIKREGLRNAGSLTSGFKELWKLYQSEMRSLLHDYLATDGNIAYRSGHAPTSGANMFQRNHRDRTKTMFKLSNLDKGSVDMNAEQEDLDHILESSVPGLVSKSKRRSGANIDKIESNQDGSATGHKLLVDPSVFNMSLLLPPSLFFLQRLKDIVPPGSDIVISTLTAFLDDFLVNVFQPQLDETVTELCTQSFIELDAFQQDPQWPQYARKPIFKGTSTFFSIINAFCKMLDTIPYDQAFTQLIIAQMVTYYDKCCGWYKALVTRAHIQAQGGIRLKTAAALAEAGEVRDVISKLWQAEAGELHGLLDNETALLIMKANEMPLEPYDIISDRKSVAALSLLYTSMQWLASKLARLRHITDRAADSSHQEAGRFGQSRRWTLLYATRLRDSSLPVYLPMTPDTAVAFDGIVSSFQELAMTVLFTLHIDIRCGIIHMIERCLHGNYQLEQPANDADGNVLALNADLVSFDENITSYLRERARDFITTGLGFLLDQLLVTNASHINTMNLNGCGRMQLNILVLQQNLKNIEDDVALARSAQFFDFFTEGPDAIIARAKETGGKDLGFSYEELKLLVELCYSEGLKSSNREVATTAKRALNDHLLALSEHLWQT
ncbi:MAG: hypothetical protein M1830_008789 [Pleopsidium flavum]|nr:MAG: hypothetical protein M1830_008789 [Pleopsidium flavum]